MSIDKVFIVLLIIIALFFPIPQLPKSMIGIPLPQLNHKTSNAYAKVPSQNRWQNDSSLSTFNPAGIPIDTSSQHRNILSMRNHLIIANQILSIRQLFGDWQGSFSPQKTNTSLIYGETELTLGRDNWRLSYIRRIELFLRAGGGLVELMWYDKNKIPLPPDKSFHLYLKGEGFEAHGVKFSQGRTFSCLENKKIGLGFAVSFLKGIRTQKALIEGEAHMVGSKDYDYSGTMNYYYDYNYLYDREDIAIGSGHGITCDIGIGVDITKRLSASLLVHDIWGQIWWQDVPYTDAFFDSHNKKYDENGYVIYNPSISGWELTADITQKIFPKTNLCLHYQFEKLIGLISADFIERDIYPNTHLTYCFSNFLSLNCGYNLFFHQMQIGIRYHDLRFGISFDQIDPKKTKAFSLLLDFGLRF